VCVYAIMCPALILAGLSGVLQMLSYL